jgi:hypothetical protein
MTPAERRAEVAIVWSVVFVLTKHSLDEIARATDSSKYE